LSKHSNKETLQVFLGATGAAWLLVVGIFGVVLTVAGAYLAWTKGTGGLIGSLLGILTLTGVMLLVAVLGAIWAALWIGLPAASGMLASRVAPRHRGWAIFGAILALAFVFEALPATVFFTIPW
jgi:hypothetical protein